MPHKIILVFLIECELRSAVLQYHKSLLKDAGGIEASIELGGSKVKE